MKFPVKDFFSKCDQIPKSSHLPKKSLMKNFIFCVVNIMETHYPIILEI